MKGVRLDYPILAQGSDAWLELRKRQAATCSQFGNAFGVGYKSRSKYMRVKLGLDDADEMNEVMKFGIDYEDWVCLMYCRFIESATGHRIQLKTHGYRRFTDDPDSGGSPDRIVVDLDTGASWPLEIKTRLHGGMRDFVPDSHKLQCVGIGVLFHSQFTDYCCWTPDEGILLSRIRWEKEFWTDHLWPAIREFNDLWRCGEIPARMPNGLAAERRALIDEMVYATPLSEEMQLQ